LYPEEAGRACPEMIARKERMLEGERGARKGIEGEGEEV